MEHHLQMNLVKYIEINPGEVKFYRNADFVFDKIGDTVVEGGSGYVNGQYANISLTGGSGGGLKADITVAFGTAITNAGAGYSDAEYTNVNISSVSSVAAGAIQTFGVTTPGADYANGTYTNVPLSGGNGTNATADVTISGGGITSIVPNNPGSGYQQSDPLTVSVNDLGGSKLFAVSIGSSTVNVAVTVGTDTVGGQANGVFYLNGVESPTNFPIITGQTYIFDQSDSTNANWNSQAHPLMFSTGSDGDHNGNGHYLDGVTYKLDGTTVTMVGYVSGFAAATTRVVEWVVPSNAPSTLYYWCHSHTGQGDSFAVSVGAGGSGYTDGTYLNVDLVTSSGSGSGAKANVTVASGSVSNVTIANEQGSGYTLSDSLTIDGDDLTIAVANAGSITQAGSNYANGTYTGVSTTMTNTRDGLAR